MPAQKSAIQATRSQPSSESPDLLEKALTLHRAGMLDGAIVIYREILSVKPDHAEAHCNLGNALCALNKFEEASACYHRALSIKPDYAEVLCNLGNLAYMRGRLNEALAYYQRTLPLVPNAAEIHYNLGLVLKDQGKSDAAIESFRRALVLKPDHATARSSMLLLYSYRAALDPYEYLSQARGWEMACLSESEREAARRRTFRRSLLAGRRLRVGYVSGDFRQHAVSYFIEQLFAYHDRTRVEVYAYSSHGRRDAVTERLQALSDHWIPVAGVSDSVIRDRIEADGIDVLVDLSGYTPYNRLGAFARRAAPVQAHYLGYWASTGLSEMDYFIGDEVLTPPETDSHFSEQVWRLPRVRASYDGKADAPIPAWQPAQNGTIWVGSFNNFGKLTPATLELWAGVLHALPEGKLLLKTKGLADAGNRQRILDDMISHGIPACRIELEDGVNTPGWSEHMAYYDRLDVALDPVGAHGGYTTTCDALWMGVPVITLEGDCMVSRMAASIVSAVGHPEWIVRSEAAYVDHVCALARDIGLRKRLRFAQRERMANSPLCDAKGIATCLEDAYIEMFARWQAACGKGA